MVFLLCYHAMWLLLFKLWTFKLLWIFIFVVLIVTAFLMVMYNSNIDELNKDILYDDDWKEKKPSSLNKKGDSSKARKLQGLTEVLSEKENRVKASKQQLSNAEGVFNSMKMMGQDRIRDRFKHLLTDLKSDLIIVESEVKTLQNEVANLSKRREDLKNDLLNQQADYQKMLDAFDKELEGNTLLSSTRTIHTKF